MILKSLLDASCLSVLVLIAGTLATGFSGSDLVSGNAFSGLGAIVFGATFFLELAGLRW